MKVGLRKGVVEVVEHQSEWISFAVELCEELRCVLKELAVGVQHVGSTSVVDLPAKPIIDIAVALKAVAVLPEITKLLKGISYQYSGDAGGEGGLVFLKESEINIRTVHLHIVEHTDPQWNNYIRFRNLLSNNHEIRKRYAQLKHSLGITFQNDRVAYTEAKHDFIQAVMMSDSDL